MNYLPITKTTDWRSYTERMIDLCAELGVRHYIKQDLQPFLPKGYSNPLRGCSSITRNERGMESRERERRMDGYLDTAGNIPDAKKLGAGERFYASSNDWARAAFRLLERNNNANKVRHGGTATKRTPVSDYVGGEVSNRN